MRHLFIHRAALLLALGGLVVGSTEETDAARFRSKYARPHAAPARATGADSARVALGKALFFDARLSASGDRSCASCHDPKHGWADTFAVGRGTRGQVLGRRTPTLFEIGHGSIFFWDGRAATLEEQALGPIQSPQEMDMPLDRLVSRLAQSRPYPSMFSAAFGDSAVTAERVGVAIADYERLIRGPEASFDRWVRGDTAAISAEAKAGFVIFNTKARCAQCHSGWRFTDDSFHDIGVVGDDLGRGKILPDIEAVQHAFKTPTLRGAVNRAPYMHNGSEQSLRDVIELYDVGGRVKRASLSAEIRPLGLTEKEKQQLLAFLRTLGDARLAQLP